MFKLGALLIVCVTLVAVNAYPSYMVKGLATGQWAPPGTDDVRGPCPGLNTLANHGFLPRNGQNITRSVLVSSLESVYNFSTVLANTLAFNAILVDGDDGALSLDQLDNHETIEHDASMTRNDFYFGDNHSLNITLLNGLIAQSADGLVLTTADFAYYQSLRQNNSAEINPDYSFGFSDSTLASGEPALILTVFGTTDANGDYSVPISSIKSVFALEQLPAGWNGTQFEVDTPTITSLSALIKSMWTST